MTIALDLLFVVIGVLMFALATNANVKEIGRLMLAAGLIGMALFGDRIVTLFGGR